MSINIFDTAVVKILARSHMLIPRLVEMGCEPTRPVLCSGKDEDGDDIYRVIVGGTRIDDLNFTLTFDEGGCLLSCEQRTQAVCGLVSLDVPLVDLV